MYCSSCGSAIPQNLNYCNRCGAKVNGEKGGGLARPGELLPVSLVNAMAAVFIVGLGAVIGLMAVMKKVVGFDPGIILAVTAFSLLLMLLVEGVLIRLLLNGKRGARAAGGGGWRLEGRATQEIGEAQARILPDPVPSVTEHTTRAFEPIHGERNSR